MKIQALFSGKCFLQSGEFLALWAIKKTTHVYFCDNSGKY